MFHRALMTLRAGPGEQRSFARPRFAALAALASGTLAPLAASAQTTDPFQTAWFDDNTHPIRVTPVEIDAGGGGGRPEPSPFAASMTASFSNFSLAPGVGIIGGDVLEFDVTITNTSPASDGPAPVLTAFAFQSKFSESPALASRIGDKLFSAVRIGGTAGPLNSIKKNGTSNGLFTGGWKGICINSSTDFRPEFNGAVEDESLECAGSRTDADGDGEPELDMSLLGLRPGESQTVRVRLDSGTTDGALHRVPEGTLTGTVGQGPDGFPFLQTPGNVLELVDFVDNKVLFDASGAFDPSFAPAAGGFTLGAQQYLTFPRVNFAFTDILGRNHTCGTYGLTGGSCAGGDGSSPTFGFLDVGDLIPGVQNFAALLQGFGEFVEVAPGEYAKPNFPYGPCETCGGRPYVPIAEFYVDNGDGESVTRQIVAGSYGALGTDSEYVAAVDATDAADFKQEILSAIDVEEELAEDEDGGGPPPPEAFGATADASFTDFTWTPGGGLNGGDTIEFNITIRNTSPADSGIYLTSFNFQSKERGLADISRLDGTSQTRRDIRLDSTLPACDALSDGACWNSVLGVGHFPNVIGNGLLFAQMVWPSADAGRTGQIVDSDQVFVDPVNGITPTAFQLESVKKNGPFTPILRGNRNFICVKSGLFNTDPDADAACAGEPAILVDPLAPPTPDNVQQRLGLAPGAQQTVRMRMDFGDFRGALFRIQPGTLTDQAAPFGLQRSFDCSDQRELEYCHPDLAGENIGYLPGTDAVWQTPIGLADVEYVITNQPGDAPSMMNFEQNFGAILAMAGFRPSAEFYKPDVNPDLPPDLQGTLIREQVLGSYGMATVTLDAFDSGAAPLSANWTGATSRLNYRVAGGALQVVAGGPLLWRQPFGSSQEAAFRLTRSGIADLSHMLLLKVGPDGQAIIVSYLPRSREIMVDTLTCSGSSFISPRRLGRFRAELRAGQELRARALANGSVRVFIDGRPVGNALQAGAAFADRGGQVGLLSVAPGARIEYFSGGNR